MKSRPLSLVYPTPLYEHDNASRLIEWAPGYRNFVPHVLFCYVYSYFVMCIPDCVNGESHRQHHLGPLLLHLPRQIRLVQDEFHLRVNRVATKAFRVQRLRPSYTITVNWQNIPVRGALVSSRHNYIKGHSKESILVRWPRARAFAATFHNRIFSWCCIFRCQIVFHSCCDRSPESSNLNFWSFK